MRFPPYYVVAVFYNFSSHLQPMAKFYDAMSVLYYMFRFATFSEAKTITDLIAELPVVAAIFYENYLQ